MTGSQVAMESEKKLLRYGFATTRLELKILTMD